VRVVVAPNAFRDGPGAAEVSTALAHGVRAALPRAQIERVPLADGGDGTLEALARLYRAEIVPVRVHDLRTQAVEARLALAAGDTAIIEMADVAGVRLLAHAERDPFRTSTLGVGELVRAALATGARQVIVGAGGSGTIDVGAGALAALGARFLGPRGEELEPTPAGLEQVRTVELDGLDPRLCRVQLVVLADVRTPLRQNLHRYGAQKGVRADTAARLQRVVERLGALAAERGIDVLKEPWLGAGGGLAGGLHTFAGARVEPGAESMLRRARLADLIKGADLLLTGEGCLDPTSADGKLPVAVARFAAEKGVPAVIIAGNIAGLPPLPVGVRCVPLDGADHPLKAIARAAERAVLEAVTYAGR
jgi:glycerate 2-kinase